MHCLPRSDDRRMCRCTDRSCRDWTDGATALRSSFQASHSPAWRGLQALNARLYGQRHMRYFLRLHDVSRTALAFHADMCSRWFATGKGWPGRQSPCVTEVRVCQPASPWAAPAGNPSAFHGGRCGGALAPAGSVTRSLPPRTVRHLFRWRCRLSCTEHTP